VGGTRIQYVAHRIVVGVHGEGVVDAGAHVDVPGREASSIVDAYVDHAIAIADPVIVTVHSGAIVDAGACSRAVADTVIGIRRRVVVAYAGAPVSGIRNAVTVTVQCQNQLGNDRVVHTERAVLVVANRVAIAVVGAVVARTHVVRVAIAQPIAHAVVSPDAMLPASSMHTSLPYRHRQ
jgi:hypothetical protein